MSEFPWNVYEHKADDERCLCLECSFARLDIPDANRGPRDYAKLFKSPLFGSDESEDEDK